MTGNVSWGNTGEVGNNHMYGYLLCIHINSEKYSISCGTRPVLIKLFPHSPRVSFEVQNYLNDWE